MHSFDDFRAIVQADQPLAPHVWFRLGGPARFLARPPSKFGNLLAFDGNDDWRA